MPKYQIEVAVEKNVAIIKCCPVKQQPDHRLHRIYGDRVLNLKFANVDSTLEGLVLPSELKICGRRYEFFGYKLKTAPSAHFFAVSGTDIEKISLAQFLDSVIPVNDRVNTRLTLAKFIARQDLLFSSTVPTCTISAEVLVIPDILSPERKAVMTDGAAPISPSLLFKIISAFNTNFAHAPHEQINFVPTAIQARFGGCKVFFPALSKLTITGTLGA